MKKFIYLFVFLAAIFTVGCSNPSTPAGHEGYVKEDPRIWGKGGYRGSLEGPANYGLSICRNKTENVDFRPITYPEIFKILTKDELNISFRFQTIIKIKEGTIKTVVEKYAGAEFYNRYIKEPLRSIVRNHVQILESREVKNQRQQISEAVMNALSDYLKETPFIAISGVVGNIDYPISVAKAVEKKLAAKQLLDEKETQKEIAKKNAQIRVEEAKGIAKAQKIINATLTKNYLQHEAINAQLKMASSPNHTTVYIPSGANGIPMVGTLTQR